ncbi:Serine hydroxymethyltransferase, cytosolic [Dimargaris xerosporica]|nr:Serine hydroxymethyltransferase, cytosolic [Dimargaris xerosporica]
MTTRGLQGADFAQVAEFIDEAVDITKTIQGRVDGKRLRDFKDMLGSNVDVLPQLAALRAKVVAFSQRFPVVGFDAAELSDA